MRFVFVGSLWCVAVYLLFVSFQPLLLTVSFFDVGQGDAVFIEGPRGAQMLVDGGAGPEALRELGRRLGFFDRSLDAVIATHPDQDHIGGLPDIFSRYRVNFFLEPGIPNDTSAAKALDAAVHNEVGITKVIARRGMRIHLGRGAYADVLFPDRDVSKGETNAGSIVMRVGYGDHEFMLTGDAPESVERHVVHLATEGGLAVTSDVLKAGHHGSKTSSSAAFIDAVHPTYVVFSRGCDNLYGHPHPSVVERFTARSIKPLDTCEQGTITFTTDGVTLSVK